MATEPLRLKLLANNVTRLKLQATSLKMQAQVRYPATLGGGSAITVTNANGGAQISLDYTKLIEIAAFDPTKKLIAVFDPASGWNTIALSDLINNAATIIQVVNGAGDVAVGNATQLLVMNRAVDQTPSNIILPLSTNKVGRVKVVDFKGNASAFPHTVKTSGADTFQGALTQWALDADGSSVIADPIPGTGYAV